MGRIADLQKEIKALKEERKSGNLSRAEKKDKLEEIRELEKELKLANALLWEPIRLRQAPTGPSQGSNIVSSSTAAAAPRSSSTTNLIATRRIAATTTTGPSQGSVNSISSSSAPAAPFSIRQVVIGSPTHGFDRLIRRSPIPSARALISPPPTPSIYTGGHSAVTTSGGISPWTIPSSSSMSICPDRSSAFPEENDDDEESLDNSVASQGVSQPTALLNIPSSSNDSGTTTFSPQSLAFTGPPQVNSSGTLVVKNLTKEKKKKNQDELMEYLDTKPYVGDKTKLKDLAVKAGLRRDTDLLDFSDDLGYYFIRSDKGTPRRLSEDLTLKWKWSSSASRKDYSALRNATQAHKDDARERMAALRAETPDRYIVYMADVFTTSLDVQPCREGHVSWGSIYDQPGNSRNIYPGYWTSKSGFISMRTSHFEKNNNTKSKIFNKIEEVGLDKAVCLEIFVRVCRTRAIAQQAEAFIMAYCDMWNFLHPYEEPYLTGPPDAELVDETLKAKAQELAIAGKPLFEIVPEDQPCHPLPYSHVCELEEITRLPYKIHASDLKERWIPGSRKDENGADVENDWGERIRP